MLRLDSTTRAEYDALGPVADRAAHVVAALGETVTATVYDDVSAVRASGSMQTPWAIATGARIVVGELASFVVTNGGVPDGWTLRFEGNARWVEGSFGLAGEETEFRWSLETFTTGQLGAIGTAEITARGLEPVAADFAVSWNVHRSVEASFAAGWDLLATAPLTFTGVPDPIQIPKGGTYNLAQHASGGVPPYTYLAVGLPEHVTLNPATSVLTATEDAVTGSTTVEFTIKDSIEQTAPGLPMQGQVWDGSGGPNALHFMSQGQIEWKNYGVGDWMDATDAEQGTTPYLSFSVSALTAYNLNVATLVEKWVAGTIPNKGFFFRGLAGDWNFGFAGRLNEAVDARPVLTVVTTAGTFTPPVIGAQHWIHNTLVTRPQGKEIWNVQRGARSAILQFDMTGVVGSVVSANLKITCVQRFSSSPETIGVFAANSPEYKVAGNMLTRGFADSYPKDEGIAAHPAVIWSNREWGTPADFWGGWDSAGGDVSSSKHSVQVDPQTGIPYFRLRMEPGALNGMTMKKWWMRGTTAYSPPTSITNEAYMRYRLYLEDDWRSSIDTTKAPGLNLQMGYWVPHAGRAGIWQPVTGNGGDIGSGRKKQNSSGVYYEGHSMRGHVGHVTSDENPYNEIPHLATYAYHLEQGDLFGQALRWGNFVIQRERWYNIEHYIKMNTLSGEPDELGNREANFDGIHRVWVDGELAYERTNLRWTRHPEIGVSGMMFEMYHGGTSPPSIVMHCRWANVVVASEYIGPVKEEPL